MTDTPDFIERAARPAPVPAEVEKAFITLRAAGPSLHLTVEAKAIETIRLHVDALTQQLAAATSVSGEGAKAALATLADAAEAPPTSRRAASELAPLGNMDADSASHIRRCRRGLKSGYAMTTNLLPALKDAEKALEEVRFAQSWSGPFALQLGAVLIQIDSALTTIKGLET